MIFQCTTRAVCHILTRRVIWLTFIWTIFMGLIQNYTLAQHSLGFENSCMYRDWLCPLTKIAPLGFQLDTKSFTLQVPGFRITTLSHELQKGAFSSLLHKTRTSITFSQIVFYYHLHQTRSRFYVSPVQHPLDFSLQRYTSSHLFRHALRHSMVVRLPSSF